MRTRTEAAKALDCLDIRRHVSCWIIERTDGTKFYFTDHNRKIVFDGNEYEPVGGFDISARELSEGTTPPNMTIIGVLSTGKIEHNDLRAGLYRDAKLTQNIIDYRFPFAGYIYKNIYYIKAVTFDGEKWKVELEGQTRLLKKVVGSYYTRNCRYTLGDAKCQVDLEGLDPDENPYKESLTVSQIDIQRRTFRTSGSIRPNDYFNDGVLVWSSGNNDNVKCRIKDWILVNNIIELHIDTPFNIQVGDTFDLYPGCDKLKATCKDKFDNLINYGGFPFVPGADKTFMTPKAK